MSPPPPRPILSARHTPAGGELQAGPTIAELRSKAALAPSLGGSLFSAGWINDVPSAYAGDKPDRGQAASGEERWLPTPQSIKTTDIQLSSSQAQRRALQGLQHCLCTRPVDPAVADTTYVFNTLPVVPAVANPSGTMQCPLIQSTCSPPRMWP